MQTSSRIVPVFDFGRVVATPGALALLIETGHSPAEFLDRHVQGFWGDVGEADWKANEAALKTHERLFSAYTLHEDARLWIITEWDRSYTTLLLPEEY